MERINASLLIAARHKVFVIRVTKSGRQQSAAERTREQVGTGRSNNKCNTGGFCDISLISVHDYAEQEMMKKTTSVLTPTTAETSTFL